MPCQAFLQIKNESCTHGVHGVFRVVMFAAAMRLSHWQPSKTP